VSIDLLFKTRKETDESVLYINANGENPVPKNRLSLKSGMYLETDDTERMFVNINGIGVICLEVKYSLNEDLS
jgi:hypothetical protein